jgi:zinc and cadmium transporter
MSDVWIAGLVSVGAVSLISLIGVITLAISEEKLEHPLFWLIGLGIGALLGDAFIHLLPEAYEKIGSKTAFYLMGGFVLFFILEKLLHWRHKHTYEDKESIQPFGYLNLFADAIHNIIDGVLIGVSYIVSFPVGLATTVAVILHEIPQELGDYGILREANFSKTKALLFNFISGLFALVGLIVSLVVAFDFESFVVPMLAFTAGGFFYMAFILLRHLSEELTVKKAAIQVTSIFVGIILMWLLKFVE